jgi:hypothetical protein
MCVYMFSTHVHILYRYIHTQSIHTQVLHTTCMCTSYRSLPFKTVWACHMSPSNTSSKSIGHSCTCVSFTNVSFKDKCIFKKKTWVFEEVIRERCKDAIVTRELVHVNILWRELLCENVIKEFLHANANMWHNKKGCLPSLLSVVTCEQLINHIFIEILISSKRCAHSVYAHVSNFLLYMCNERRHGSVLGVHSRYRILYQMCFTNACNTMCFTNARA